MAPDYSSIVGVDGALSKSGRAIYDSLRESPEFFPPGGDLESILRDGLLGLDLLVLTRGADFFFFFQRFEGKVVNAKLQIPLPRDFFG